MSSYLNSYFIEPALRQARRFSSPRPEDRPPFDLRSQVQDSAPTSAALQDVDDTRPQDEPVGASPRRQSSSEPGQLSLSDVREAYSNEEDAYRSEEIVESERDADIARQNGLQGLLPLNDLRSNYLIDQEPVDSPAQEDAPHGLPLHEPPRLRQQDASTLDSLGSMSLDDGQTMTSNPSHVASQSVMSTGASSSSLSSRSRRLTAQGQESRRQSRDTLGSLQMSTNLPEDDGMRIIRQQMHQINEMALSADEKAARMHALMTADYEKLKALQNHTDTLSEEPYDDVESEELQSGLLGHGQQRQRANSHASTASCVPRKSSLTADANDLIPTYQPRPPPLEGQVPRNSMECNEDDAELPFGCPHYRRNVKVQCTDCYKWYTCRHCHDSAEKHALVRNRIRSMLCMACGTPQRAAEYCMQCSQLSAAYYCDICKLWDNDTEHRIYHCPDCGICRIGQGLGKDYVHCKRCNVCINIAYSATHRCVERATECDCPICGDWMFTSSTTVVAVECGHYMHRPCYDALMRTSFKCPICNRSAVNMELQWRKLDHAIEAQPMPSQFKETRVWITCNDCSARTCTNFHWLGNKCTSCDSYNTNQVKMINSPSDQELQAMQEVQSQEVQALRAAEQQMGTQDGNAASNVPVDQDLPTGQLSADVAQVHAPQPVWRPSPGHLEAIQQPYHADPVSPPTSIALLDGRPDPSSYFPPHSPSNRGSATDVEESEDAEMTDSSPSDSESVADDPDGFWGEPVSPSDWVPSIPQMSSPTWSMPSASMPRLPSVSMPSMPNMPSMRAISPTTIWAAGSPSFSGWNLPSPSFFPRRRISRDDNEPNEDHDDGEDDEQDRSESSSSDEEDGMEPEGEEDGDVDEMELFGHR